MRGRETATSRAKAARLTTLKRDLGKEKSGHLDRQKLIDCGKMRAEHGAGKVTLGIDNGVIKMIITHEPAVHGLDRSPEPVDLARVAPKRLGLIGKGTERDRRPTTDELNRLIRCFADNVPQTTPMTRIAKFAVATAMRLDEVGRVEWRDLDVDRRMLLIRDRKDPRKKTGNNQRIPLFAATGFDARRNHGTHHAHTTDDLPPCPAQRQAIGGNRAGLERAKVTNHVTCPSDPPTPRPPTHPVFARERRNRRRHFRSSPGLWIDVRRTSAGVISVRRRT